MYTPSMQEIASESAEADGKLVPNYAVSYLEASLPMYTQLMLSQPLPCVIAQAFVQGWFLRDAAGRCEWDVTPRMAGADAAHNA